MHYARYLQGVILTLAIITTGTPAAEAFLLINEVLADPATGINGDANRDGATSSSQDEFIELFHTGTTPIHLAGWTLSDAVRERHIFDDVLLQPQNYFVIFGGGNPVLPGILQATAFTGSLGLNNNGDTIVLKDASGDVIDTFTYGSEGGNDQSVARFPDGEPQWYLHSEIAGAEGELFSPGRGFALPQTGNQTPIKSSIPEPTTMALVGFGSLGMFLWRREHS